MSVFFFFNDTATTEIYTLSLHDALPISRAGDAEAGPHGHRHGQPVRRAAPVRPGGELSAGDHQEGDRKSTRLNSSHANISYAVFCLKKKNISLARLDVDLFTANPDPEIL